MTLVTKATVFSRRGNRAILVIVFSFLFFFFFFFFEKKLISQLLRLEIWRIANRAVLSFVFSSGGNFAGCAILFKDLHLVLLEAWP